MGEKVPAGVVLGKESLEEPPGNDGEDRGEGCILKVRRMTLPGVSRGGERRLKRVSSEEELIFRVAQEPFCCCTAR